MNGIFLMGNTSALKGTLNGRDNCGTEFTFTCVCDPGFQLNIATLAYPVIWLNSNPSELFKTR